MKNKIIYLIIWVLLLLLAGCSFTDQQHVYVEPELRHFVERFHLESVKHGHDFRSNDINVVFDDLDVAGLTSHSAIPVVRIDRAFFASHVGGRGYDSLVLECLVFHELGHAWLKKGHEADGRIMGKYLPYDAYTKNREALLNELFE